MSNKKNSVTLIDASNLIVGRLASHVAKRLLLGDRIAIVNAEVSVFSGRRRAKIAEYEKFFEVVGRGNPRHGPRHPKRPDTILKRIIRGMLPMDKSKGMRAFKALRVYVGYPSEIAEHAGGARITVPDASATKLNCQSIALGDLSKEFGWKGID
ncbi:MAG: 50S ribosomal protein L13 [Candidatus Bathyarchaeia archaeon]